MGLFDIFKKKQENQSLDFSAIDSNQKAQELYAKGELVKMYLMPLECGGEDSLVNILFVPQVANNQKEAFDAKLIALLESGLQLGYSTKPEYNGNSFIPNRVTIQVTGDRKMTEVIEIW